MKLKEVLIVVFALCFVAKAQKSFRNYKTVSLKVENYQQLNEMKNLETQFGFIFLDPPVQVSMNLDLVIQPEMFPSFEEIAKNFDINFEVTSDDLQRAIDAEKPSKNLKEGFSLDKYNQLEDINNFLNEIEATHGEKVTVINIGESFENRTMKVVKISTNENNPAIFIEANIHAREWISSATALWIINQILVSTDLKVREIVDGVTWYILPVTNPDGYQYTHDFDRLWRKNRSIHNVFCRGTDPNRNFGFNWRMGGSSRVPCTDTYSGPTPFSEKETRALMDYYGTISNKVEAYLAFHSAAELLLYPMGHTIEPVSNEAHLRQIASVAVDAIKARHDVVYGFGNVIEKLYIASGSSPDHAYGVFKTPIAFTYEFRAGRGEGSRFILPPEEIKPNSEEIFDSLLAIIQKSKELGYFNFKD